MLKAQFIKFTLLEDKRTKAWKNKEIREGELHILRLMYTFHCCFFLWIIYNTSVENARYSLAFRNTIPN